MRVERRSAPRTIGTTGSDCLFDEWGQAQVEKEEAAFDLGQGGKCDEKDKRDCGLSSGSSSAVRSAYIASSSPRQRLVIVRGQGASLLWPLPQSS